MDERIALAGKLGKQAEDAGRSHLAESWGRKLVEYQHEAGVLRDSIGRLDRLAARAVQNE
jgi:two-component system, chemotaxis family, protein-glutamate methylesterase/glutaminase